MDATTLIEAASASDRADESRVRGLQHSTAQTVRGIVVTGPIYIQIAGNEVGPAGLHETANAQADCWCPERAAGQRVGCPGSGIDISLGSMQTNAAGRVRATGLAEPAPRSD